jgi:hypothetical protein
MISASWVARIIGWSHQHPAALCIFEGTSLGTLNFIFFSNILTVFILVTPLSLKPIVLDSIGVPAFFLVSVCGMSFFSSD